MENEIQIVLTIIKEIISQENINSAEEIKNRMPTDEDLVSSIQVLPDEGKKCILVFKERGIYIPPKIQGRIMSNIRSIKTNNVTIQLDFND